MSNEINVATLTGRTVYVLLFNQSGQVWDAVDGAFETYATAQRGNYDIPLTELGTASGVYLGNFPTAINSSGSYTYYGYIQGGGSPAEGDTLVASGVVDWTGSASAGASTGAMTASDWRDYLLRQGFERTDKDTELYEATTDAIQIMRRRFKFDEAKTESTSTDTISTLGDFKISVESDLGMVINVVREDSDYGSPLKKVSKERFDELYGSINVETDKGYPEHYCIYAGSIYIGPIPDKTSYTYRVSYSKRGGTITSSTTAVPFTALYRDLLADLTMSRLYRGLDEFEKADYFESRYEREFPMAKRQERLNSGESTFMVKPTLL